MYALVKRTHVLRIRACSSHIANTYHLCDCRYRAILVNMLYSPDKKADGTDVTWGEFLTTDASKKTFQDLCQEISKTLTREYADKLKKILATLERSSAAFWDRPVRFVVETQFILKGYLEMRKHSHIW